jgi:transposase-like protein
VPHPAISNHTMTRIISLPDEMRAERAARPNPPYPVLLLTEAASPSYADRVRAQLPAGLPAPTSENPQQDAPADEAECYTLLIQMLHPEGLACPRCWSRDRLGIHRRHRAPVLDYQCGECGRVFNAWTGTALEKTHRSPRQLLQILLGIARGRSTAQLARELECHRPQLLALRRRLQPLAASLFGATRR